MPKVAVTLSYFDYFPELKDELRALYPDIKFLAENWNLQGDALVDYL